MVMDRKNHHGRWMAKHTLVMHGLCTGFTGHARRIGYSYASWPSETGGEHVGRTKGGPRATQSGQSCAPNGIPGPRVSAAKPNPPSWLCTDSQRIRFVGVNQGQTNKIKFFAPKHRCMLKLSHAKHNERDAYIETCQTKTDRCQFKTWVGG